MVAPEREGAPWSLCIQMRRRYGAKLHVCAPRHPFPRHASPLQREALSDDYLQEQASPEAMEPEDEEEMFMQDAPNDTMVALQLLRSQFPAKARVGTCLGPLKLCLPCLAQHF